MPGAVDVTPEDSTWKALRPGLEAWSSAASVTPITAAGRAHYLDHFRKRVPWRQPTSRRCFFRGTRAGYAFAVDRAKHAGDPLIAANKDTLTKPALNDRHFLKGANGAIGTMDMAKMEAMGGCLFASGILLDRNGKALKERPYFETYP
ncbi:hypothetical protein CK215_20280 [Mesorhizobium sp. WSM3864]|uniref:hypothetical protein n=1 Tax=Mesorhizobium sp. WSM3864 TaxID=2029404 RepID=UPI000BAEFC1F|nr:hypothetical protein [Mesorhizobium sp. WSM3864]PBB90647.1 hypothetical protein CK215_20280 [Mesorhizobium sp. WSM3864]